jgi:hypothetical protein
MLFFISITAFIAGIQWKLSETSPGNTPNYDRAFQKGASFALLSMSACAAFMWAVEFLRKTNPE